jgi:SAM-dependent methyltransferase
MANEYQALAPVYDRIGMSRFAEDLTARLLTYAQQNEWMGRHILDLGCGTGALMSWFAKNQSRIGVTGVDYQPEMLALARANVQAHGVEPNLIEQDIRQLEGPSGFDMVVALDVLNELDGLRDLGTVFSKVRGALAPGKLFVFDLHTFEGLINRGIDGDHEILNDDDFAVFVRNRYDYERQAESSHYTIFSRTDAAWQRSAAQRLLRGFPIQAVITLLRRNEFGLLAVTDEQFAAIDPNTPGTGRILIIARK